MGKSKFVLFANIFLISELWFLKKFFSITIHDAAWRLKEYCPNR